MIRRLRGPDPGDVRDIDRELVIGRESIDVVIADAEVSRRHAVLRPVADGVEVEDLGSSNGTFVDGQQVHGKRTITQNASLRVGPADLRIEIGPAQVTRLRQAGIASPDVTARRPVIRDVTVARPQQPAGSAASGPSAGEPPAAGGPPGGPPPGQPPAGGPPPGAGGPPPGAGSAPTGPTGGRPNRRAVLVGVGGLALAALVALAVVLLAGGSSANKTAGTRVASRCPAKLPPLIQDGFPEPQMRFSHNGALDTSLHMTLAKIPVAGLTYTTGIEYEHQLPAPTLVFCPGDLVTVHLSNGLPLSTNLHLHGLHVSPNGNGDNVFVDVKPLTERTYQYQIPLDQAPGFYWYHPHLHPLVQPEEAGGAAGGIIVEGSLDQRLPNVPERIMIIQGGNRRSKGTPPGTANPPDLGPPKANAPPPPIGVPQLLVNGVQNPAVKIRPGEIQRWRILNATSDRLLQLKMPGVTFQVLAQDGITLHSMLPEQELLITPGSRVEVLVRGGKAGLYTLSALPFHQCHKGCNPFAGPTTGITTPTETVLSLISNGAAAHDQLPSGPIGSPPDLRRRHVDVQRRLLFTQSPVTKGPPGFQLDKKLFNPARVDITMKLGSVEEWTLENPTTGAALEWHTFHIHQNPFQVISINGRPLSYVDWQDNVTLAPGDKIVIRMNPTDFTGKFVFHCHVIFHEDHGMMGTAQVVKDPTPSQVNVNRVMYLIPPTGRALFAAGGATGSGLRGFLLYCRHLLQHSVT